MRQRDRNFLGAMILAAPRIAAVLLFLVAAAIVWSVLGPK